MNWWPGKYSASDEDISVYVFTSSCQMIGLCLAVIGILSTDPTLRNRFLPRDYLLAIDTTIFLVATTLAYIAMRWRKQRRLYKVEATSEGSFIIGMILMVFICIFLMLELI